MPFQSPPKGFKLLMSELESFQKFVPVDKQKEFGFLIKSLREREHGISLCRKGQETLALTPEGEEIFRFTDRGAIAISPRFSIYDLTKRFWRVIQDTNPYIGKIDELKRNNKLLNERIVGMDDVIKEMHKQYKEGISGKKDSSETSIEKTGEVEETEETVEPEEAPVIEMEAEEGDEEAVEPIVKSKKRVNQVDNE